MEKNRMNSRILLIRKKKEMKRKKRICRLSIIAATMVILFTGFVLFKNVAKASADEQHLKKYYKSEMVHSGDTLWSIASENKLGYDNTKEFIEEVVFINHLQNPDDIQSGEYLIIPYYKSFR